MFGPLAELNNTSSSLHPPISSKKKYNRLTMRTTKEKVWNHSSPSSSTLQKRQWPTIYIFGIGADCHATTFAGLVWTELPNNVNYLANAMTVIRTGLQDYFSVPASQRSLGTLKESEVWKLCKREICTASCEWWRSLCAFSLWLLTFRVLQHTKENDVTVCVFYGGMCHIRW